MSLQEEQVPGQEEELVAEDDQVIGKALRWSLVALVGIGVVVALVLVLNQEQAVEEVVIEKEAGEIANLSTSEVEIPSVQFTDVTAQAGIDFVHEDGARGEKLLPETMGGGSAFFDADSDGDPDLFLTNGAPWPHDGGEAQGNRYYQNDGSGKFTDRTQAAGLGSSAYSMGVAVGDIDADGSPDLYVTNVGANQLYRNTNGNFEDITAQAGTAGGEDQWSSSAGFFDLNEDGYLDLFVCNYVQWSRAIDESLAFTLNGTDRAYGPPTNYSGCSSSLYYNRGDGSFEDVSEKAGIGVKDPNSGQYVAKALGVVFMDYNHDGKTDIAVANDTVQNHLFSNNGDGTFDEVGSKSGIGFDRNGNATGAMGIDLADFRGDGGLGIGIGNFANEMSSLFVMEPGRNSFTDSATGEGIGSPSRRALSFGLFFFDFDLDGRQDLLQVNGHLEESINEVQPSQHYRQAPQLFWNAGPKRRSCFVEVPAENIGDMGMPLVGRGSSYADIDGDGDLDVILCQVGDRPVLLRNDQDSKHHWLRVKLDAGGGNPDGIGAWVAVTTAKGQMRRQVTQTKSYLSQSELPLTFGLGTETAIQSIVVTWPDGEVQEFPVQQGVDREVVLSRVN